MTTATDLDDLISDLNDLKTNLATPTRAGYAAMRLTFEAYQERAKTVIGTALRDLRGGFSD